MEFPYFSGKNPGAWLLKFDHLFTVNSVPEAYKLRLVKPYLRGRAERWFEAVELLGEQVSWDTFAEVTINQFGSYFDRFYGHEYEVTGCSDVSEIWVAMDDELEFDGSESSKTGEEDQIDELDEMKMAEGYSEPERLVIPATESLEVLEEEAEAESVYEGTNSPTSCYNLENYANCVEASKDNSSRFVYENDDDDGRVMELVNSIDDEALKFEDHYALSNGKILELSCDLVMCVVKFFHVNSLNFEFDMGIVGECEDTVFDGGGETNLAAESIKLGFSGHGNLKLITDYGEIGVSENIFVKFIVLKNLDTNSVIAKEGVLNSEWGKNDQWFVYALAEPESNLVFITETGKRGGAMVSSNKETTLVLCEIGHYPLGNIGLLKSYNELETVERGSIEVKRIPKPWTGWVTSFQGRTYLGFLNDGSYKIGDLGLTEFGDEFGWLGEKSGVSLKNTEGYVGLHELALSKNKVIWMFDCLVGKDHIIFQSLVACLRTLSIWVSNSNGASKVFGLMVYFLSGKMVVRNVTSIPCSQMVGLIKLFLGNSIACSLMEDFATGWELSYAKLQFIGIKQRQGQENGVAIAEIITHGKVSAVELKIVEWSLEFEKSVEGVERNGCLKVVEGCLLVVLVRSNYEQLIGTAINLYRTNSTSVHHSLSFGEDTLQQTCWVLIAMKVDVIWKCKYYVVFLAVLFVTMRIGGTSIGTDITDAESSLVCCIWVDNAMLKIIGRVPQGTKIHCRERSTPKEIYHMQNCISSVSIDFVDGESSFGHVIILGWKNQDMSRISTLQMGELKAFTMFRNQCSKLCVVVRWGENPEVVENFDVPLVGALAKTNKWFGTKNFIKWCCVEDQVMAFNETTWVKTDVMDTKPACFCDTHRQVPKDASHMKCQAWDAFEKLIMTGVVKGRFGEDLFVENPPAGMYFKCAELEDAHMIFDILLARYVHAWNSIGAGYYQGKYGWQANPIRAAIQLQKSDSRLEADAVILGLANLGTKYKHLLELEIYETVVSVIVSDAKLLKWVDADEFHHLKRVIKLMCCAEFSSYGNNLHAASTSLIALEINGACFGDLGELKESAEFYAFNVIFKKCRGISRKCILIKKLPKPWDQVATTFKGGTIIFHEGKQERRHGKSNFHQSFVFFSSLRTS